MSQSEADNGWTARAIRNTYHESLSTRQQYRRSVGTGMEQMAHRRLQEVALDYFDTLRPLIATANATAELWQQAPLWPTDPRTTTVAKCPECDAEFGIDVIEEAPQHPLCPECEAADRGAPVLERAEVQAIDPETGDLLWEYERGLETLDDVRLGVVEIEETFRDAMGEHTRTRTEKRLLEPEHLLTILDYLDEAMQRLGILADIEDNLPKGRLDPESEAEAKAAGGEA